MEAIKILEKLVSFNTIKDKENKEIMDYIEKYLNNLEFKTKRINKCLVASIGSNPKIGFVGHTDTVDYESWDGNPFEVQKKDDKLIGLGVCDMKGGIAALLSSLSKIDLSNKNLSLYFTNDEEIGFEGILSLQEEKFPETILIGEPTNNIPVYGTKGLLGLDISFYGVKCHSSTPEKGKNAIYEALDFITELRTFYETKIKENKTNDFEIPYTTMNIGTIKGGETVNSVPGKCSISIDFRINREEDIEYILSKINVMLKKYNSTMKVLNKIKPKLNLDDINFIESISSKKETANYLTEASFIESKAIILGVGPITAHEKNEYITKDSLIKCEELYIKILEKYQ